MDQTLYARFVTWDIYGPPVTGLEDEKVGSKGPKEGPEKEKGPKEGDDTGRGGVRDTLGGGVRDTLARGVRDTLGGGVRDTVGTYPLTSNSGTKSTIDKRIIDKLCPNGKTGIYSAPFHFTGNGEVLLKTTAYMEFDPAKLQTTAYGSNQYGFLTLKIEPEERMVGYLLGKQSMGQLKVFVTPFSIDYIKLLSNESMYLYLKGGGVSYWDLVGLKAGDPLTAMIIAALVAIIPKSATHTNHQYRIQMHQQPDGSIKLGRLERFTFETNWVDADSEALKKYKSFFLFSVNTNTSVPATLFDGAVLKPNSQQLQIQSTPPAEYYQKWAIGQSIENTLKSLYNMSTDVELEFKSMPQ